MKYLITGGCGFLGSNIASEVLKQKNDLLIYDNLSRIGGEDNLSWLKSIGNFEFIKADTNNFPKISEVIISSCRSGSYDNFNSKSQT